MLSPIITRTYIELKPTLAISLLNARTNCDIAMGFGLIIKQLCAFDYRANGIVEYLEELQIILQKEAGIRYFMAGIL